MATREEFQLSTAERRKRIFSKEFKRQKVREIERKITTIAEVSKAYQVRDNNVRKWMILYSSTYKKGVRLVVEMESETKKLIALQAKIAELERIVGQKQLTIDFQAKMIELAEQSFGIDIKKKFETKLSSTSGNIENSSAVV
jgi:transposase-like protein